MKLNGCMTLKKTRLWQDPRTCQWLAVGEKTTGLVGGSHSSACAESGFDCCASTISLSSHLWTDLHLRLSAVLLWLLLCSSGWNLQLDLKTSDSSHSAPKTDELPSTDHLQAILGKKEDHPGARESKHGAVVTTLAYNSSVPSSSKISFHMPSMFVDPLLCSKKFFFPLVLHWCSTPFLQGHS